MAGQVAAAARRRQGAWRPEAAALLVAQVERFAAQVRHRIVMPWRQAEFMGVLLPGISLAAFRHHAAELRVGDDVRPWQRRALAGAGGNHIFLAVRCEATQAIHQDQVVRQRHARCRIPLKRFAARLRQQWRHAQRRRHAALQLLGQGAALVAQDGARHGLQQHTVFRRNAFGRPHENAARPVDGLRIKAGGDQPHDLVVQRLRYPERSSYQITRSTTSPFRRQ